MGGELLEKGVTVPGKPYQSKLRFCHDEIFSLLDGGMSYRQVAEALNRKYGLGVTHNAVFSYVKPRAARSGAERDCSTRGLRRTYVTR